MFDPGGCTITIGAEKVMDIFSRREQNMAASGGDYQFIPALAIRIFLMRHSLRTLILISKLSFLISRPGKTYSRTLFLVFLFQLHTWILEFLKLIYLLSGAQRKYGLLWIILVASCAALVIQSLAANLGVVTGKHLAQRCRTEYEKVPNFILWILAEISIVARDIPEVIETAFSLSILFNIPVWCSVLMTGLITLVLLALQQFEVRKLEFLIDFYWSLGMQS